MSNEIYDVSYFINKFEAIPEELWCEGVYQRGEQRCAAGHCGESICNPTRESLALSRLMDYEVVPINDGRHDDYPQPTPKQRILAALRDIKNKQENHERK